MTANIDKFDSKYFLLGKLIYLKLKYEYNNINWKDQVTKFNDLSFTYDIIGNPIIIGNDTLTWSNGRQLKSYNDNVYKYNYAGIRKSKLVNGVETNYYLEGTSIIFEKRNNDVIYYIRNNLDSLIGFKYNNDIYYYIKNLQNDIIGILDSNYNLVVKYRYDSWGKILAITDVNDNNITDQNHIGHINPFRYRSYYYDNETNLYYLNNRYYSPILRRFLNSDNIIGSNENIMSYNLYSYCNNNPISQFDFNGTSFSSITSKIMNNFKAVVSAIDNKLSTYDITSISTYCQLPKPKKKKRSLKTKVLIAVTKVTNTITNYINDHVSISAGTGPGFSASAGIDVISVGAYEDYGFRFKDGKWELGHTSSVGIKFSIHDNDINLNFSKSYFHPTHYIDGDVQGSIDHSQLYASPSVIHSCPLTEGSREVTSEFGGTVEYSGYEVCIVTEIHIFWGGHAKLCFR